MTGLLFIFLGATLISQSFMDAMSVVIIIYMVTKRFTDKTTFAPITHATTWTKDAVFILSWLILIAIGLRSSARPLELLSEWKWLLNLYFMYWFLNLYFETRANAIVAGTQPKLAATTPNGLPSSNFWPPLHWILLACFAYGAISYFSGIDLFKQTPLTHGKRFAGPFDDPMNFAHIYGMYFVFLAPFLIDKLYSIKSMIADKRRLILLITLAATGLSVYLTLTRGAWMGVFAGLATLFFLISWRWGLSLIVVAGLASGLLYANSETFKTRIDQALNPSQGYDSERLNLWKTNWAMFKDHPIVGVGHGDYKKFLPVYFEKLGIPADHFQSHAHNQYLHFLSNTGALGLIFYLVFIGYLLMITYQGYQKYKDPNLLGSLGAQIAFHVGSITECNFERAKVRLVYLFFCALAISIIAQRKKQKRS